MFGVRTMPGGGSCQMTPPRGIDGLGRSPSICTRNPWRMSLVRASASGNPRTRGIGWSRVSTEPGETQKRGDPVADRKCEEHESGVTDKTTRRSERREGRERNPSAHMSARSHSARRRRAAKAPSIRSRCGMIMRSPSGEVSAAGKVSLPSRRNSRMDLEEAIHLPRVFLRLQRARGVDEESSGCHNIRGPSQKLRLLSHQGLQRFEA